MGQRADAFDDEYVAETEATITQLRDATTILREIETATATLGDALSTFETLLAEPPLEASNQVSGEENEAATPEAEQVDPADPTDE